MAVAPIGTGTVKSVSIACALADPSAKKKGAFCEATAYASDSGAQITRAVRKHFDRKGRARLKLVLDNAGRKLVKQGPVPGEVNVMLRDGAGDTETVTQPVTFVRH